MKQIQYPVYFARCTAMRHFHSQMSKHLTTFLNDSDDNVRVFTYKLLLSLPDVRVFILVITEAISGSSRRVKIAEIHRVVERNKSRREIGHDTSCVYETSYQIERV